MNNIDWYKATVWCGAITFCMMFWLMLYVTGLMAEFFGLLLCVVAGYFTYMSSVLVSEKKEYERRNK